MCPKNSILECCSKVKCSCNCNKGVYKIGRLFGLSIVNGRAGPSFLASCVVDQLLDGMNDGESHITRYSKFFGKAKYKTGKQTAMH